MLKLKRSLAVVAMGCSLVGAVSSGAAWAQTSSQNVSSCTGQQGANTPGLRQCDVCDLIDARLTELGNDPANAPIVDALRSLRLLFQRNANNDNCSSNPVTEEQLEQIAGFVTPD